MEGSNKEETVVIDKLKETCYPNGREIVPKESAVFIRQLGLIYKNRAPDKICLIQSAALLNAARVRRPGDVIENDLREFCSDLLRLASADNKDADLLNESLSVAQKIKKMRYKVTKKLLLLPVIEENATDLEFNEFKKLKIDGMNIVQKLVTDSYKNLMKDIASYCTKVMGKLPCKFALVGLGSISRREITPYSDFENIIILEDDIIGSSEYKNILEYFRWWSVIFQVILINLGETLIPCVAIPTLNDPESPHYGWYYDDVTKRGISFDGMIPHACKFPLGRTVKTENKPFTLELIKPVSEMAKLVEKEEDIKNGYHLADMLTTSCFVEGDNTLYLKFQSLVEEKLHFIRINNPEEFVKSIEKEVEKQTSDFNVFRNLDFISDKPTFNIKSIVYRTSTIFVSALGRLHNIQCSSCIDIIDGLYDKNIITGNDAVNLKFIIAVACEARIKVYTKKNSQGDTIANNEENSDIVEAVGIRSLVYYFLLCENLQNNMMVIHKGLKASWQLAPRILYHFKQYSKSIELAEKLLKTNIEQKENCYVSLAWCFTETGEYEKALKYYELCVDLYTKLSQHFERDGRLASIYHDIGMCMRHQLNYKESINYFERSLKIRYTNVKGFTDFENLRSNDGAVIFSTNLELNQKIAGLFLNIGVNEMDLRNYEVALVLFAKALGLRKHISKPSTYDRNIHIAKISVNMGACYFHLGMTDTSLKHFSLALGIYQRLSNKQTVEVDVVFHYIRNSIQYKFRESQGRDSCYLSNAFNRMKAVASRGSEIFQIYNVMALAYVEVFQYEKALVYYDLALKEISSKNLIVKAELFGSIGNVLMEMNRYESSMKYLNQALEFRKSIGPYDAQQLDVAIALNNISACKARFGFYLEALPFCQESVEMQTKLGEESSKQEFASASGNYGLCLLHTGHVEQAQRQLEKSLAIEKRLSEDALLNVSAADRLINIGLCYYELQNYQQALINFDLALDLYDSVNMLSNNHASAMADCLSNKGLAKGQLNQHSEAKKCFEDAISLKESNHPPYPHQCFDAELAVIYSNAGGCYFNLGEYHGAIGYLNKALPLLKEDSELSYGFLFEIYKIRGRCFEKLGKLVNAVKDFDLAKKFAVDKSNTVKMTATIGQVQMKLKEYKSAQINFNSCIYLAKLDMPKLTDDFWAKLYFNSGNCCLNLNSIEQALIHFENALLHFYNISSPNKDINIEIAHHQCRICLTALNRHDEAFIQLTKQSEARKRMSSNTKTDQALGEIYIRMGSYAYDNLKFSSALEYLEKGSNILVHSLSSTNELFLVVNEMLEVSYMKTFCCYK